MMTASTTSLPTQQQQQRPSRCSSLFAGRSYCRMLLLMISFGLIAMLKESQSLRGLSAVMVWSPMASSTTTIEKWNTEASERNDDDDDDNDSATTKSSSSKQRKYPIAWLLSFPNSGTSYTMTLVERASNLSTATNYGTEVTPVNQASLALPDYPVDRGPYWEGLEGAALLNRTVRHLPDPYSAYVLTKTHCGSRCIHCGPSDYVQDASEFLQDCLRTSRLDRTGHRVEHHMRQQAVARLVHLIRNPLHNIVARYHLERRHFVLKDKKLADEFPNNAEGFQKWCRELDDTYQKDDVKYFRKTDPKLLELFEHVPCHGEFYKFTQWHNLVLGMQPLLHHPPTLTIFYEDYQYKFRDNVDAIMTFVSQPFNASRLREFRSLPTYQDYFAAEQIDAIHALIKHVAVPEMYELLKRYFESTASTAATKRER